MPKSRCSKAVLLLLIPTVFSGCGEGAEVRRDVYARFEDCMADWGEKELCTQLGEREKQELMAATGGPNSGGANAVHYIYGPSYDPSYRSVDYGGRTIAPTSSKALASMNMPPHASFARAPSGAKPGKVAGAGSAVSRGGTGVSGARAAATSSS